MSATPAFVIGLHDHPANVIFRVVSKTRNGWLHCEPYCRQDGTRIDHHYANDREYYTAYNGYQWRFRISGMREITVPAPKEEAA